MSTFSHLLVEHRRFPPPQSLAEQAYISSFEQYLKMYQQSIRDPDFFWLKQTEHLHWFQKPSIGCRYEWNTKQQHIHHTWFEDGVINVSFNCLDRHLASRMNKPAILWQGDEDGETISLTYGELYKQVCLFANALKAGGIGKGDRVCLYLPMIPELPIAMLACARIGAIHSVIFGGFNAEAIIHRVNDSSCKLLVTSNVSVRGGKKIFLKEIVDEAMPHCPSIEKIMVVKRDKTSCPMQMGRDVWFHDEMERSHVHCPPEQLNAEDPLFILYTSGSTGKPKGVVHSQAGYLLHAALSHRYVFDIHEKDIYWCTADIGWVTGHSYIVYGPLANGATTLMFEGIPAYPDPGRFWQIIDKFGVTAFYTAPTAIRALIYSGKDYPDRYRLDTLRILGTVGEPINPEAWMWYYETIGKRRCPIMDTWWQTETGGIMITPLPGSHILKPGSASRPFFGIEPVVLKENGTECQSGEGGYLCIRKPWPGIMRTSWGDHHRFIQTYFTTYEDVYFTGDGCRIDKDGDYWLLGRIDDVVNISGHRIGTAEVESALVSHPAVAEAAVVPIADEIKGQSLAAYIIPLKGISDEHTLKAELREHVKKEIGAIAIPDKIHLVRGLPKTRSGKIMRRILRKIANEETDNLGDISTLADPQIIKELIDNK